MSYVNKGIKLVMCNHRENYKFFVVHFKTDSKNIELVLSKYNNGVAKGIIFSTSDNLNHITTKVKLSNYDTIMSHPNVVGPTPSCIDHSVQSIMNDMFVNIINFYKQNPKFLKNVKVWYEFKYLDEIINTIFNKVINDTLTSKKDLYVYNIINNNIKNDKCFRDIVEKFINEKPLSNVDNIQNSKPNNSKETLKKIKNINGYIYSIFNMPICVSDIDNVEEFIKSLINITGGTIEEDVIDLIKKNVEVNNMDELSEYMKNILNKCKLENILTEEDDRGCEMCKSCNCELDCECENDNEDNDEDNDEYDPFLDIDNYKIWELTPYPENNEDDEDSQFWKYYLGLGV